MAFYALNVHSEVDRRWKRDKARPFSASSCGRRGGFVRGDRSSSDRRTGDGGGCSSSFLLSSPRGEETGGDKNLGRYISAGCAAPRRHRERENPLSAEGRGGRRLGSVG